MNRFLDLPLPHRLLIVGVVLALLGAGVYFLVLSGMGDQIRSQTQRYKNQMAEYSKLKEFDSPDFREKLDRERAEAHARSQEYAKMLPRERELPDLITSIKADADGAGLVLTRFEPLKSREAGEGYLGIPIEIQVLGTYHQMIGFLEAIAAPSKRLVSVRNLDISAAAQTTEGLSSTAGDFGALRVLAQRQAERGLTPVEQYARTVLQFDETAKRTIVSAKFTAMAYIYTGGAK
jgi:Tfp pilus assembly protein PilO